MAYSTISKPSLHFNTKLYTGNGSTQSITGVGFQPDWTWLKSRSNANVHALFDAVRGVTKRISSNDNSAEYTEAGALTAFDSDGFSLGNWTSTNGSGHTLASWNWKANGSGSANTDGSINSTVSVNQTAGFSIVKWTGTQSLGTVGHGLNATPDVILIKNVSAGENWIMYHVGLGGNTKNLYLDATNAVDTRTDTFNSTSPTSSLFTVNTATGTNKSGSTMMAYCFAGKKGYSKFGSYTGNGNADGTFVYTGFKPAFVLIKHTNGTSNWTINDTGRDPTNVNNLRLFPNTNVAESTGSDSMDMLSNGFKFRSTDGGNNGSGDTYIYMAFAEEPLVANVGASIPATAR